MSSTCIYQMEAFRESKQDGLCSPFPHISLGFKCFIAIFEQGHKSGRIRPQPSALMPIALLKSKGLLGDGVSVQTAGWVSVSWKTSSWIIASCLNKFSLEIHLDAASSVPAPLQQWWGTDLGGEAAASCCLQRWPRSSCRQMISVLIRFTKLLGGLQWGGM